MSKHKYIPFDEKSLADHFALREAFAVIESLVVTTIAPSRQRSIVTTKLEEAFLWAGKAIFAEQMVRNPPVEDEVKPLDESV